MANSSKAFYFVLIHSCLAMPDIMVSAGWKEEETVNHYKPRFLHALNALSNCKMDKPVTIPEVVDYMDKPAAFDPTEYKTIRDSEADAILHRIVNELVAQGYLAQDGDSLFATKVGLEKRKALDYWKRTPNEKYDCDQDNPRLQPSRTCC